MAPAYYVFYISIIYSFDRADLYKKSILGNFLFKALPNRQLSLFMGIFILTIIMIILSKKLIKTITETSESIFKEKDAVLTFLGYNEEIVSFLLGSILPSIIVIENSFFWTIMTFLLIQLLIYKLMVNTSSIFINIWLIIFHRLYFVNAIKDNRGQGIVIIFERKSETNIYKNKKYIAKCLKRVSDDGGILYLGEGINEYTSSPSGD